MKFALIAILDTWLSMIALLSIVWGPHPVPRSWRQQVAGAPVVGPGDLRQQLCRLHARLLGGP